MTFGAIGVVLITGVIIFSQAKTNSIETPQDIHSHVKIEEAPPKLETSPDFTPSAPAAPTAPLKTFVVKGVVTFEGVVPQGKKLNLPSGCKRPGSGDVYSNEVIVNSGKVQNVLVRVMKGQEGLVSTPVPSDEVILDQKGCMYTPRVVGARVGQKVTFLNSDPIFHNVRSVTNLNQRFNVAMPKKDQRETRVFNKPELFLQAKCSVHPWMGAYVAIMDHSFFAVTNSKGEFSIPLLPPGNYTLEAWHEVFGTLTQDITISETGVSEVKFNFKK